MHVCTVDVCLPHCFALSNKAELSGWACRVHQVGLCMTCFSDSVTNLEVAPLHRGSAVLDFQFVGGIIMDHRL
jgi:hypothetical protein